MTFHQQQQELFHQPATGNVAVLTCGHKAAVPHNPRRTRDDWWAAIHCHECQRTRQVATVIYQQEPT